ncbi:MAG: aspartate--tRNA ligase [Bacteroidales bacterium]|nr:aspartate--tRNA ligase [Bacteroidales bacterium]
MYRDHTCGELRISDAGKKVTLAGWVQRSRKLGGMTFIDLRDRYGITQLVVEADAPAELVEAVGSLGREFVIQATGEVVERSSKNPKMPTGDIEIRLEGINVLNASLTPPFTIEDNSDGGEDIRAKYRYLDLRRNPLQKALQLRHRICHEVRNYLDGNNFLEIETPFLINSTPEGARDFVVPSRMNPGTFYALPQSPQTLKQSLMVAGMDRYFQIVKCFRDEDLRADRQPEFTQIDCEMSFVQQEDVLNMFEGMMRHLFKTILNVDIPNPIPRMTWFDGMDKYGSDKPDIRFGMLIHEVTALAQGHGFSVFDGVPYVGAIAVPGAASYSRKQTDELTEWVKRPQIGAKGLVYIKLNEDGSIRSSVDKFFSAEELQKLADAVEAVKGDLVLILCGEKRKTQTQLGQLRIELGGRLGFRKPDEFAPLWLTDFPLFEWNDEENKWDALHHPFTAPKPEHLQYYYSDKPEDILKVCANAYDFVLNGTELGGGSIRIHNPKDQARMFQIIGIGEEEMQRKFGFLINAFKYGAPPHGGLAFGLDRVCALFGGSDTIRDYIAFPKNNQGKDIMLGAPSVIDSKQLDELYLDLRPVE